MGRTIKYIVFHCTATDQSATIENIKRYWKEKLGWKNPGYHFIIEPSGNVTQLHPLDEIANGVKGYNSNSIHISYIGGLMKDDRTPGQITAQKALLRGLLSMFPGAEVIGHKDFPRVTKSCPRFDAKTLLE